MELTALKPGEHARVVGIESTPSTRTDLFDTLSRRLMELGFIPGTIVTMMHRAPLARDPMSFSVRGMHIALRRSEAKLVRIDLISAKEGGRL